MLVAVAACIALAVGLMTNPAKDDSWIKATHEGTSVELECNLETPIYSYAIYEDVYENGELISSEAIVFDCFQEDGGATPRRTTLSLDAKPVNRSEGGFSGELSLYFDGLAHLTRKLPKNHYTGIAYVAAEIGNGISGKQKVVTEDDVTLLTILISTDPDGEVVVKTQDSTLVQSNDTVVIYRFVTSEGSEAFQLHGEVNEPVQLGDSQTLSLNDVIMLSQKGYDLTWSDFEEFEYTETGSGLYIRVYEINEMYELWIGGSWIDEDPMYIHLALADDLETRIDIRDGGVTEFVGADHSEVLLAKAINEAILDHFKASDPDGLLHCASFVSLAQQELCIDSEPASPMQVTVYGMALHEKYGYSGATFHVVESWYNPIKLTFEKTPTGAFHLSDAWFPKYPAESAEQHGDSIYEQFSMHSEDLANSVLLELLDNNYLTQLKQKCYDQAARYGGIDTYSAVEYLFEMIESSPVTSFRPADYIDANPAEYKELLYYGDYTLQYIFSKFHLEGNQTGLRGHLMRIVLDDLAPEARLRLYAETGQEYFDEWKAGAIQISEQHDMDWIKENQPAIWLFLRMGGE